MSNNSESAVSSNDKQQRKIGKSSVDPTCWSVEDVGAWLKECNLGEYVEKFHVSEIDGSVLINDGLDDSLVKELIPSMKHRVTFNGARKKLLKSTESASDSVGATMVPNSAGVGITAPSFNNLSSSSLTTNQNLTGPSLSDLVEHTNTQEERKKYMNMINQDYMAHGKYKVAPAELRNIMLIGRTRTGKSTIKALLVNPTEVPDELSLKSGTKDPLFQSFHVSDNRMVLNIIDTPGLFERGASEFDIRDNETILNTIQICANREITMFHVICFCVAITTGINQEDIQSLKLLVKFLGEEVSHNSCLVVTHCESKNDDQRKKIENELKEDIYFNEIAQYFKLGVYFSGSLNRDDYNQANANLVKQFVTISNYRKELIELFTKDIKPFPISEMIISAIQRSRAEAMITAEELEKMTARSEEQNRLIENLRVAQADEKQDTADIIADLVRSMETERSELNRLRKLEKDSSKCPIS